MAMNYRDFYIVLRARDEATRVLRSFGGSLNDLDKSSQLLAEKQMARGRNLMMLGTGMFAVGALGVSMFADMTKAAMDYEQQAAASYTQTDKLNTSVQELGDIGLQVGKTVPVQFDQIQASLYDIFSSMDVTVPEAQMLLENFAKAAVGGNADMQVAGKATIAILNAWGMAATDVTHVNDVMFQLVRKGVGTYDQFANSIGRAIPSAVRAGQSVETLAGMLAFLTRNGLSTSQAATSAARSLDALSNVKTVQRMKDMGIVVTDLNGEFAPLVDILGQLNLKFKDMTSPERAAALQNLLGGTGSNIQSRRFFDEVFKNFDAFEGYVNDMENSSGALQQAYDTMFNTPQAKMQLMTNKFQAMRIEMGEKLLPVIEMLAGVISGLIDKWDKLSPGMQRFLVITAAVGAAITALVGIITAISGASLVLTSRFGGLVGVFRAVNDEIKLQTALSGTNSRAMGVMGTMSIIAGRGVTGLSTSLKGLLISTGIGLALAAITIAIGVFINQQQKAAEAARVHQQAVDDLANAIMQENGAIDDNVRATAVKTLSDQGLLKTSEKYGLSLGDVTDAYLGNADAMRRVRDTMASVSNETYTHMLPTNGEVITSYTDSALAAQKFLDALAGGASTTDEAVTKARQMADAQNGGAAGTAVANAAQKALNQTLKDYSAIIPDVSASTDDITKAIQTWLDEVGKQDASFIDIQGAYDNMVQKNKDLAQAVADSTKDSSDSWDTYIGKFPNTVDEYLAQLQTMVDAQNTWEQNLLTLSSRLPEDVIKNLADLGPKGAPLVAQLVTASDDQLQKLVTLFGEGADDATGAFSDTLARAIPVVSSIATKYGQDAANAAAKALADGSATVESIMEQYNMNVQKHPLQILVDTVGAQAAFDGFIKTNTGKRLTVTVGVNGQVNYHVQGTSVTFNANGGPISGPGGPTSDSIPAMLSNGEHVWSAREVQGAGGHSGVERLRSMARNGSIGAYATGGRVQWAQSQLSAATAAQTAAQNQVNNLTAQLDAAKKYYDTLNSAKKKNQAAIDRASANVDATSNALDAAKDNLNNTEDNVKTWQNSVDDLQKLTDQLTTSIRRGDFIGQATGGLSGAYNAIDQLVEWSGNTNLSAGARNSLASMATSAEPQFKKLYTDAQGIADQIDAANENLRTLQGISDSVASALKNENGKTLADYLQNIQAAQSGMVEIQKQTASGDWYTTTVQAMNNTTGAAGITASVQGRAAELKAFADKLQKLQAMGLSGTILQEVAQLGTEAGGPVADALIQGGTANISALNSAYQDVATFTNQAGSYVTDAFYQGGVDAAQGLIDGLTSKQNDINNAILAIAQSMQNTLAQALEMHSPSRKLFRAGQMTGEGYRLGVLDKRDAINAVVRGMAGPVVGATSGSAETSGKTIEVKFEKGAVQTQEIDPKVHSAQLGFMIAEAVS